jgi:hypothetical protein
MTHCLFHHGVQALTGDLRVRFLEPVPCDSLLDLRARIEAMSPPLYRVKAELVCDERVMAWAEARFLQRVMPQSKGTAQFSSCPARSQRKSGYFLRRHS